MISPRFRAAVATALGTGMALLIVAAVFLGSGTSSAAVPSPSQYTTPTPSGLSVADYAVIGILVAMVLAGMLVYLFFLRGGEGGAAEPSESGGAAGLDDWSEDDQDEPSS